MLTTNNSVKLFDIINRQVKDEVQARAIVSEIEQILRTDVAETSQVATSRDLMDLRAEFKSEIEQLSAKLAKIAEQPDTGSLKPVQASFLQSKLRRDEKEQFEWLLGVLLVIILLTVAVIKFI